MVAITLSISLVLNSVIISGRILWVSIDQQAMGTTFVTELRDRLAETLDALQTENAVMILRNSKPAAYLLSTKFFESLIEQVEDLVDYFDMRAAIEDYHQGKVVGVGRC